MFLALHLDVQVFPSRKCGLARHSKVETLPPSFRFKAGVFVVRTGLFSICLIIFAGDVILNPGPKTDPIKSGFERNSSFMSFTSIMDEDLSLDSDSGISNADNRFEAYVRRRRNL